jgi:hypothetical protein
MAAGTHPAFVNAMFDDEPAGTFSEGYVFRSGLDLEAVRKNPDNGYWHCDLTHSESLTWSDKVYDLFGIRPGAPVAREWAVTRYSEHSRDTLDRVRKYGLSRDFGFILDAEIEQQGGANRWIRVLAVPITADERIVGLHGVKRALGRLSPDGDRTVGEGE